MLVRFDCKHFRGDLPCKPNKQYGAVCDGCGYYLPIEKRVLIIKLGAIGDVIRTTPLIKKYRDLYPNAHITWLTLYPDVLPAKEVDEILAVNAENLFMLQHQQFDIAINLDKEKEACILLSQVTAKQKYGFTFLENHIHPSTENARHKLITGLFDSVSKANTKSYLEEIFEICHLTFEKEEYLIRVNDSLAVSWKHKLQPLVKGKKNIGLNTGCGARWKTRLWPQEYWKVLIENLQEKGYFCTLLGGEQEDKQNKMYAQKTGAYYPGFFSLEEFIAMSASCDAVVTQVSLMMHITIALKIPIILLNNIFNANEFELYGRGAIVEPNGGCDCYYGTCCTREKSCMYDISPSSVEQAVSKLALL